nr:restriction endonuclease subunit S [Anoxybacillus sp. CHMUD]
MFGDPLRNNKNFEVVKLGEYTTHVSSGVTPRGGQSAYVPQGIPLIRSQNVHMNKLNLDDVVFITEEVHESMKRSQLRKYDVLLNITGASIGRVAVYLGENNQANVNQHVCIIRLTEGVNPFYLSYYIASPQFQHSIKFLNSGATREALNYTQIKNFNILLPPLELQNKFAEIVQKIESQKDLLQKSLEELENNFSSLMQQAFKGELFND